MSLGHLIPVEIAFRDVHSSPPADRELHRTLRRLAAAFPELTGCRVLVEPGAAAAGHATYHVHVDLTLPRARVEVDAPRPGAARPRGLVPVLREALARARRELARASHRARRPRTRSSSASSP
jgi:hypothetical protein